MASSIITLTTDFGLADHYVGVMKGVIASINPDAKTVDISHQVRPYCIAQGAFYIAQAYRFFPAGTVHLVVVDPGVGTARRPIVALAGGHYFVAPDNGVLSQVFEREPSVEVRQVDVERYALKRISRTFHGRDIFAPVSAWLSKDTPFEQIGIQILDWVTLPATAPAEIGPGRWRGRVLNIDQFGNVVTSFTPERLAARTGFRFVVGQLQVTRLAESYEELRGVEPFLIAGSSGYVEVSMKQESAAERARVGLGDSVEMWESEADYG